MSKFELPLYTRWRLIQVAREMRGGASVFNWHAYTRRGNKLNAFYNERMGIVVKKPLFVLDPRTPNSVKVPTIRLDDEWIAQPIVKKVNLKRAYNRINKTLAKHKGIYPDLHCGNIGWYQGKAVMFDW